MLQLPSIEQFKTLDNDKKTFILNNLMTYFMDISAVMSEDMREKKLPYQDQVTLYNANKHIQDTAEKVQESVKGSLQDLLVTLNKDEAEVGVYKVVRQETVRRSYDPATVYTVLADPDLFTSIVKVENKKLEDLLKRSKLSNADEMRIKESATASSSFSIRIK